MKKLLSFLITIVIILCFFTGCDLPQTDYVRPEEPHLYWKDINVVVTDIATRHWFASTHWYQVDITVESKEYGLERTFTYKGSGMFGCPSQWGYDTGDVVKAELYSWVMDSTGEVVRREIHAVY